jgi:hypothetical protein
LAFASANANVPEVERLTSRETRAEERVSATQQLCIVLVAAFARPVFFLLLYVPYKNITFFYYYFHRF